MASRNLNFPQSYGTSSIVIAFRFQALGGTGATPPNEIRVTPTNGYSVSVVPGTLFGSYKVTTTDSFKQLVSANFVLEENVALGDIFLNYERHTQPSNLRGRIVFDLATRKFDPAGPSFDRAWSPTTNVNGIIVVRNSSVKF